MKKNKYFVVPIMNGDAIIVHTEANKSCPVLDGIVIKKKDQPVGEINSFDRL